LGIAATPGWSAGCNIFAERCNTIHNSPAADFDETRAFAAETRAVLHDILHHRNRRRELYAGARARPHPQASGGIGDSGNAEIMNCAR